MKLYKISITKKKLRSLNERELLFLVQVGSVLNEINTLERLIFLSSKVPEDPTEHKAQKYQSFFLLLLLIGKLWEIWQLLQNLYFKGRLSKEYDSYLSPEAKDSLKQIKDYYSKRGGWLKRVRDKISFHYDFDSLQKEIDKMPDDAAYEMYLSEDQGNSLYISSGALSMFTLLGCIGNYLDPDYALKTYFSELADLTRNIIVFFNHCMMCIGIKNKWDENILEEVEIPDPPDIKYFVMPYFLKNPNR